MKRYTELVLKKFPVWIKVLLAAGGDIKQSRGIKLSERIKKYIKDIEENATEEDWLRCMKKISYISARKN